MHKPRASAACEWDHYDDSVGSAAQFSPSFWRSCRGINGMACLIGTENANPGNAEGSAA